MTFGRGEVVILKGRGGSSVARNRSMGFQSDPHLCDVRDGTGWDSQKQETGNIPG